MAEELWVVELKERDVVTSTHHWKAGRPLRCSEAHARYLIAEHNAKVISKPKQTASKPAPKAETADPGPRRVVLPQEVKQADADQQQTVATAATATETKEE